MGIVFGVRGDSIDARYSSGGKTGTKIGNTGNITINSDAGYLSGSNIQFAGATVAALHWSGRFNTPNGREISVLHRYSPTYTGSPAAARQVMPYIAACPERLGRIEITHSAAGNLVVTATNEVGTTIINAVTAAAWSPVSGTIYDIVYTWDGTTGANSFKVYVDAVLQGAGITPTAAFSASWTNEYFNGICYGNGLTSSLAVSKTDEIIIWDSVINVSSVVLVSGSAALNGASRTSLVDVAAFDGLLQSSPGTANTRLSTTWYYNGVLQTGTAAIPTAANTKTGVATDATTGTYDGSDRWSVISEDDVTLGLDYKSNSLTNNKTGNVRLPGIGQVAIGVDFGSSDSLTGTLDVATASDVSDAKDEILIEVAKALKLTQYMGLK
jgi:hypothetical protein